MVSRIASRCLASAIRSGARSNSKSSSISIGVRDSDTHFVGTRSAVVSVTRVTLHQVRQHLLGHALLKETKRQVMELLEGRVDRWCVPCCKSFAERVEV